MRSPVLVKAGGANGVTVPFASRAAPRVRRPSLLAPIAARFGKLRAMAAPGMRRWARFISGGELLPTGMPVERSWRPSADRLA